LTLAFAPGWRGAIPIVWLIVYGLVGLGRYGRVQAEPRIAKHQVC